jgi:hypothetical protein
MPNRHPLLKTFSGRRSRRPFFMHSGREKPSIAPAIPTPYLENNGLGAKVGSDGKTEIRKVAGRQRAT